MKMLYSRNVIKDIAVIGGGLAGVCAAIAAARNGATVALVHDRPVLGGNASSEIRMSPLGATGGGNRFAEEMGIVGELKLESHYRNPEGNPYLWDAILLDHVLKEENIELFLNTSVFEVEVGDRRIRKVHALQLAGETRLSFESKVFVDCTGDGTVGFLAGAEYMQGREGRDDFGESFAPEKPDKYTMGNTIYFEVKDAGKPVRYVPPAFAYPKEKIGEILAAGGKVVNEKMTGFDYWWFEYGGTLDTIHDNEVIKYELQKLAYGIWDFIKNSGKFSADTLTLEWIGSVAGKRESRRFIGEYILTQKDLEEQTEFKDAVCYGGWSIDTHPEEGIYSREPSSSHQWVNSYNIPFRSLYSRNIQNLMFAGRNISATHIAFASSRVINTCALAGQAAGTGAALATAYGCTPSDIARVHIKELQQRLFRDDCTFWGGRNEDPADKARNTMVTSSGFREFCFEAFDSMHRITEDMSIILPALPQIESVDLLLHSETETEVKLEVFLCSKPQNYRPVLKITELSIPVNSTGRQWAEIPLNLDGNERNLLIKLHKNPGASLYQSNTVNTGSGAWSGIETNQPMAFYPCFRVKGFNDVYHHDNVVNGFLRPYGLPNVWSSASLKEGTQWIELDFGKEEEIREILLYFNPDFNKEYYTLRPDYWGGKETEMPRELVRSYEIFAVRDGVAKRIASVSDNYQRKMRHKIEGVRGDKVKVVIKSTWGSEFAEIFEIRVY